MTDTGGAPPATSPPAPRPYALVAELTYRCPLACAYCSNPLALGARSDELDLAIWRRVFVEAAALGVLQVNLTGGEPLVRDDLEDIAAAAHDAGHYVNLITSGIPVGAERLARLKEAHIDSIQLSIQDVDSQGAAWIAGRDELARKRDVAAIVSALGLPLTLNVVLRRGNIGRVPELITFAEEVGAARLELANTQYLGWALLNRDLLLPSGEAIAHAREVAREARDRLRGKIDVLFVRPDYEAGRPRPCMDGWARRYVVVAPDGAALPCQQARSIAGLAWWNVREHALAEIWSDSPGFRAFRGEGWMREPCRTCPERTADFGGCRCQAFALTGDAAATDPACALAPAHELVLAARRRADADGGGATRAPAAAPGEGRDGCERDPGGPGQVATSGGSAPAGLLRLRRPHAS